MHELLNLLLRLAHRVARCSINPFMPKC